MQLKRGVQVLANLQRSNIVQIVENQPVTHKLSVFSQVYWTEFNFFKVDYQVYRQVCQTRLVYQQDNQNQHSKWQQPTKEQFNHQTRLEEPQVDLNIPQQLDDTNKFNAPTGRGLLIIFSVGLISALIALSLLLAIGTVGPEQDLYTEDTFVHGGINKQTIQDIRQYIKEDLLSADKDINLLASILRVVYNQATTYDPVLGRGGLNGSTMRYKPESLYSVNIKLKNTRSYLETYKLKFPYLTFSDIWTIASCAAIESLGGPSIDVRDGRQDYSTPLWCQPEENLPQPQDTAEILRTKFQRLGFGDQELVVLQGMRCIGSCTLDGEGYPDKPRTNKPTEFSNQYFVDLLGESWRKKIYQGPLVYEDRKGTKLMSPCDIALIQNRKLKQYVSLYAADQQKFFEDFSVAFKKLIELGVNFNTKFNEYDKFKS